MFSYDNAHMNRFGLALVCDDIDPMAVKNKNSEDDLEIIYVTFLTMGFLKNTLIASGDDGYVSICLCNIACSYTYGKMKRS